MKHIFHNNTVLFLLLSAVFAGCTFEEMTAPETVPEQRIINVSASLLGDQTKVALQTCESSLDMMTKWTEGDEIITLLEDNGRFLMLPAVSIKEISADGRRCSFPIELPLDFTVPDSGFHVICFNVRGQAGNMKTIASYSDGFALSYTLRRYPIGKFNASVVYAGMVTDDSPGFEFKNFATYEVLHVVNTSESSCDFSLCGFEDSKYWYQESGLFTLVSGKSIKDGWRPGDYKAVTESPAVSIPPYSSEVIVSSYLPIDNIKIDGARMVARIDGNTVKSVNTKSSDVRIETGHAYHMYAVWNGTSLSFSNADLFDEIRLSTSFLKLEKGGRATVNFYGGKGPYKVISSNKNVVSATVGDSRISVEALSIGTATITIFDDTGIFSSLYVTVSSEGNYDEGSVDLGLSVRWAPMNLGADDVSDAGDYYSWGEVETKAVYNWSTYKYSLNGDDKSFTKYLWQKDCSADKTTVDQRSVLEPTDDAASVILKGNWRIPTANEWRELREKCTWAWTARNGVNGYDVTGPNGNSIFLPVTGYCIDDHFDEGSSAFGIYWSNTMYRTSSTAAYAEMFRPTNYTRPNEQVSRAKYDGLAIRPVSAVTKVEKPAAVDLGLSTKWCNINVGAISVNDPGEYYAWGETETKQVYNWSTYAFSEKGDAESFTKYLWHGNLSSNGKVDQKSVLDPEDDVAHRRLGGNWRMPTDRDWRALRDSCTWTWTTINYVNGYKVTGPNGNSIFLPVTGYRINDNFSEDDNGFGIYWSNTMYRTSSTAAYAEMFRPTNYTRPNEQVSRAKYDGLAIRPVYVEKKKPNKEAVDLGLSVKWRNLNLGSDALEDSGDYYAWGEILTKQVYNWSTYRFSLFGDDKSFTKYLWHPDLGVGSIADQKSVLDPEDDIAHVILDGNWRMPTARDWQALRDSCVWTWGTVNYTPGYWVSSEKTHNRIFLPVTGYRIDDNFSEPDNGFGIYWSNTMYRTSSTTAYAEMFRPTNYTHPNEQVSRAKYDGLAIRPVYAEETVTEAEAVDLGLSVNWCNINIGAKSIKDSGQYFAWGEIKPKKNYDWASYIHSGQGDEYSFKKYVWHSDHAFGGIVDQKSRLDREDDVASAVMGGNWRMPTDRDWRALRDSCKWTWEKVDYVEGYRVTGPNGNSIFLPVTGYRTGDNFEETGNRFGYYWSNTLYRTSSTNALAECFKPTNYVVPNEQISSSKFIGMPIRPVYAVETCAVPKEVDLGLSVKWCNINVGAISVNDPGEYYAWGETETKQVYNWSTYAFSEKGDAESFTKYLWHGNLSSNGKVDQKSVLDPEDDVAHRRLGGNWRMPTDRDWRALRDSCTWTWTTIDYVSGYKVTGPNGNSIFLPVTGYRINDNFSEDDNGFGIYWSNTMYRTSSTAAYAEMFRPTNYTRPNEQVSRAKYDGLAIRPVSAVNKVEKPVAVDLGLSVKWCNINIGAINKNDPGEYYAWGETKTKQVYNWSTYAFSDKGDGQSFTKYLWHKDRSADRITVDQKSVLDPEDDVANRRLGGNWRMPTDRDWRALRDSCTWTWTTINYVNGYKVTGPNGNSIFLPVTGYRIDDRFSEDDNGFGIYWSNTMYRTSSTDAYAEMFRPTNYTRPNEQVSRAKYDGLAIRPVYAEKKTVAMKAVDLGLSVNWCNVNIGAKSEEDPGDYYAWGEMLPKQVYSFGTYKYCNDDGSVFSKYLWDNGVSYDKEVDPDDITLLATDDVAYVRYNSKYRIPTADDWRELREKCTWTWTTVNYVGGYRVTGPSGRSIFLPVTGFRLNDNFVESDNGFGYYWSRSLSKSSVKSAITNVIRPTNYLHYINEEDRSRADGNVIRAVER